MILELSTTQLLAEQVLQRIRMRCNPGYFLELDRVIEDLDTESGRNKAKQRLADLYTRMQNEDAEHGKH